MDACAVGIGGMLPKIGTGAASSSCELACVTAGGGGLLGGPGGHLYPWSTADWFAASWLASLPVAAGCWAVQTWAVD